MTAMTAARAKPPSVHFLGSAYAGHRTRFDNLRAHTESDPRIRARYDAVSGWRDGGSIERLPLLPRPLKGRLRAVLEGSAFARMPRPDAIWTALRVEIIPYLWATAGPLDRPLVLDLDWTFAQQEELAPIYYDRPRRSGIRPTVQRMAERWIWKHTTFFTPWSQWAADSLVLHGADPDRIRILPPGVDLELWQPHAKQESDADRPLRLLFVGGDFKRKGGQLLLQALDGPLAGRAELDIVTRDPVPSSSPARVHRLEANAPELLELYARADLFVMPSLAECFGIATVEALASGLPAIVGSVGGSREIVQDGRTGWVVDPDVESVGRALQDACDRRSALPTMGIAARQCAEDRFDGAANDRAVVDLLLEAIEREGRT